MHHFVLHVADQVRTTADRNVLRNRKRPKSATDVGVTRPAVGELDVGGFTVSRRPLDAAFENAIVLGDRLVDISTLRLVKRRVDRVRDEAVGPSEIRVVAEAVARQQVELGVAFDFFFISKVVSPFGFCVFFFILQGVDDKFSFSISLSLFYLPMKAARSVFSSSLGPKTPTLST